MDSADVGECDNCGLERTLTYCNTPWGDLSYCDECRGAEAKEVEEIEKEPNFDCGVCGGSGGHPDTGCPGCGGSGEDRWARKTYRDERLADRE